MRRRYVVVLKDGDEVAVEADEFIADERGVFLYEHSYGVGLDGRELLLWVPKDRLHLVHGGVEPDEAKP